MIVLDTNVVSEFMRPAPSNAVEAWLDAQVADHIWICAITVYEIEFGLELIDDSARRLRLRRAFQSMVEQDLDGRVFPFDADAAARTASIAALARKQGRPIEQRDAMIAGIVRQRNATLATRNVRHFSDCGIDLIDPWSA